jgi:OmpA-OmpF porin, OOP family
VIGHTSDNGDAEFNRDVSQQRAQAVASYLRSRGVKLKVIAVGKGSAQGLPGVHPKDKSNQRTEINLVRS